MLQVVGDANEALDTSVMETNDQPLAGTRVALIEQQGFLSDYLASSLAEAGASVTLLSGLADDADSNFASVLSTAQAVVIDAQIYESDAFVGRHAIGAANIPLLLVARSGYKPVFASADTLIAPFAAYQVVDHIRAVVGRGRA